VSNITDLAALTKRYGEPKPASIKKQTSALNPTYRRWLRHSRFFILASVGNEGVDCTPRGDIPNKAFLIIDDKTIAIPDRRGNNRLDTLKNIIHDPRVALLFFIPGITQTVRVVGQASITTDQDLMDRFSDDDGEPITCIRVTISKVFFQNARALHRSELWQPESTSDTLDIPTPGQLIKSVDPDFDADTYDATNTLNHKSDSRK